MNQPESPTRERFNWLGLVIVFVGAYGQYLWWDLREPLLTQRHIVCAGTIAFGVLITFLPHWQNRLMMGWMVYMGFTTTLEVLWTRFKWPHLIYYLLVTFGLWYYHTLDKSAKPAL